MESAIQDPNIVANIFSDHSAVSLSMSLESNETKRGPGFWKFNNSLLMDKCYTEMITEQNKSLLPNTATSVTKAYYGK